MTILELLEDKNVVFIVESSLPIRCETRSNAGSKRFPATTWEGLIPTQRSTGWVYSQSRFPHCSHVIINISDLPKVKIPEHLCSREKSNSSRGDKHYLGRNPNSRCLVANSCTFFLIYSSRSWGERDVGNIGEQWKIKKGKFCMLLPGVKGDTKRQNFPALQLAVFLCAVPLYRIFRGKKSFPNFQKQLMFQSAFK